jgi:hypothetical protein
MFLKSRPDLKKRPKRLMRVRHDLIYRDDKYFFVQTNGRIPRRNSSTKWSPNILCECPHYCISKTKIREMKTDCQVPNLEIKIHHSVPISTGGYPRAQRRHGNAESISSIRLDYLPSLRIGMMFKILEEGCQCCCSDHSSKEDSKFEVRFRAKRGMPPAPSPVKGGLKGILKRTRTTPLKPTSRSKCT